MARTTSAAVALVLGDSSTHEKAAGDYDGVRDLSPFIETASALVDDVVDCASEKDITISDTRAELIERWLAAHAYALSDQTYKSKSTDSASASFHGETGKGIESTKYGQMALSLDPSGCLKELSAGVRVEMIWGGKPVSEQIAYEDRD